MSYAEVADVKARAGRLAASWSRDTVPGDAEIERYLDTVSDEIDASVAAQGFGVPVTDPVAAAALLGPNADEALVLLLDATFQGGTPAEEVAQLRGDAQARYDAFLAAIADRTGPVIGVLVSTSSSPGASNFWTSRPQYGTIDEHPPAEECNPYLAPYISRGDRF